MKRPQDKFKFPDGQLSARLWRELIRSLQVRHHEWRVPTLAAHCLGSSFPQARTVLLRHVDVQLWSSDVYTDGRSTK